MCFMNYIENLLSDGIILINCNPLLEEKKVWKYLN